MSPGKVQCSHRPAVDLAIVQMLRNLGRLVASPVAAAVDSKALGRYIACVQAVRMAFNQSRCSVLGVAGGVFHQREVFNRRNLIQEGEHLRCWGRIVRSVQQHGNRRSINRMAAWWRFDKPSLRHVDLNLRLVPLARQRAFPEPSAVSL